MRKILLAVVLAWTTPVFLQAQISPGELSASHEALEGVGNCTSCHERGAEVRSGKCLSCHANIRSLVAAKHGFHARVASQACTDCHKEHLGKEAAITRFSEKGFDHAQTGYSLGGKHRILACAKCHSEPKFRTETVALPKTAGRKTFLGLKDDCASCHGDRHNGTLGTNCRSCHTVDGWTPTVAFDHAKTPFLLAGKHAAVVCEKCHESLRSKPRPAPLLFRVAAFSDCAACHKSPHRPGFSTRQCRECHDPAGWKSTVGFDHGVTRFPLIGSHRTVPCEKCHTAMHVKEEGKPTNFTTKAFADCTPCHASPHKDAVSRLSCAGCHTPGSWRTLESRPFDHATTGFVLKGKHGAVPCLQCHGPTKERSLAVRFSKGPARCATCHEDHHRGAFAARHADCADCHSETAYAPSMFSADLHQRSTFPLTGAHQAVLCRDCHKKQGEETQFRFSSTACIACHADKHKGVFDTLMGREGCVHCHTTAAWTPARFDHGRAGFSLAGRHAEIPCAKCHTTVNGAIRYRGTPKDCKSCHADIHGGQFDSGGATACVTCHTPAGWRRLIFDHETMSAFPLTGAHRTVPCGACHPKEPSAGGTRIRFKPLEKACEFCHRGRK